MRQTAFFFDFDGVLAEIVDDPSQVHVEPPVLENLAALQKATGNAVALVSGREISQIDRFVAPLRFPAAGVHGAERRTGDGEIVREEIDRDLLERLVRGAEAFAQENEGVIAERKTTGLALHYRRRPELEKESLALAEKLASDNEGVRLLRGKMVAELKLTDRDKGHAVETFMDEPPFEGRTPVFVGDDVTDEDGFRAVQAVGGIGVKVGEGETSATTRLADIEAFRAWLGQLIGNAPSGIPAAATNE